MKLYGSDVSLNLHIKIKHNGGNKTEREKLAVNFFYHKFLQDRDYFCSRLWWIKTSYIN